MKLLLPLCLLPLGMGLGCSKPGGHATVAEPPPALAAEVQQVVFQPGQLRDAWRIAFPLTTFATAPDPDTP